MNWPISWFDLKKHIDNIEDGIDPELLPKEVFEVNDNAGEILAELTPVPDEPGVFISSVPYTLELGKTYIVELDSGVYEAVCKQFTMNGVTANVIGNAALLGGEYSGETFLASGYIPSTPEYSNVACDANTGSKFIIRNGLNAHIKYSALPSGVGYAEYGQTIIQSAMDVKQKPDTGDGIEDRYSVGVVAGVTLELIPGDTYVVELDSGTYEVVCQQEQEGVVSLGDGRLGDLPWFDRDSLSVPFYVLYVSPDNYPEDFGWRAWDRNAGTSIVVRKPHNVRPVDPMCLPGVTIDLADYGVNLFQMFMSGGGTATLTNSDKLWEEVLATDGPITLVGKEGVMVMKTQMSRLFGYINGLTAATPMFYGDKRYLVCLYVIGDTVEMDAVER